MRWAPSRQSGLHLLQPKQRPEPASTPRQFDGLLAGYMGLGIDEFGTS